MGGLGDGGIDPGPEPANGAHHDGVVEEHERRDDGEDDAGQERAAGRELERRPEIQASGHVRRPDDELARGRDGRRDRKNGQRREQCRGRRFRALREEQAARQCE